MSRIFSCLPVLALFGAIASPHALRAAETASSEESAKTEQNFIEPILIEETMPNAPGEWALRLTTDYRRGNGDAVGALPNLELFYGIIDRLGANLSVPLAYAEQASSSHYGLGDISTTLKYLLVKPGEQAPAIVLGEETAFPSGNQHLELGEGAYALRPYLATLKQLGPICVQGNIGWERQVTAAHEDAWTYGLAVSTPIIKEKLHALVEIQGDWGAPNHTTLAPGLKYYVSEKFTVGLAVPVGLNSNTSEWGLISQFQIEF
jgi:hypothetical protein